MLIIEQESLGMSSGHAETVAYVEDLLRRVEGRSATRQPRARDRSIDP